MEKRLSQNEYVFLNTMWDLMQRISDERDQIAIEGMVRGYLFNTEINANGNLKSKKKQ